MLTPTASNTIIRPLRTHVNILSQYKMGYIGFIYTNIHLSNRCSHYTMMTITSWPRFRSERHQKLHDNLSIHIGMVIGTKHLLRP